MQNNIWLIVNSDFYFNHLLSIFTLAELISSFRNTKTKSIGNDYTLREIIGRGVNPQAIRYLLFSVPCRKQLNFTFEDLKVAENAIERLQDFRQLLT